MAQGSITDSGHKVRVEGMVPGTIYEAYAAFTEPKQMSVWFTTSANSDLSVGGRYDNGDGDKGEFVDLDPPNGLTFTWENENHCPGTLVSVQFVAVQDGMVKVSIEHTALKSIEDCAAMTEGWTWALASFASYLETGLAIEFDEWRAKQ